MPAGDPAGYLPNVKRFRSKRARKLGSAIKTNISPMKAAARVAKGKAPYTPRKASAAMLPPKDQKRKRGVYMPLPDGPLVGPYRKRRA